MATKRFVASGIYKIIYNLEINGKSKSVSIEFGMPTENKAINFVHTWNEQHPNEPIQKLIDLSTGKVIFNLINED